MIKIKKIIFVIIVFFTYSSKSFAQYVSLNEPDILDDMLIDQDYLSNTIYSLLDCYLENLDREYVFDLLQEIDMAFLNQHNSTILYYFLKLGNMSYVRLFIFFRLHENLTDPEIQYCDNKSLEDESFKNIYNFVVDPSMLNINMNNVLSKCFCSILRGGYCSLLMKYSYLLDEEIIDSLLPLKKNYIIFSSRNQKKMFKYLKQIKRHLRNKRRCIVF